MTKIILTVGKDVNPYEVVRVIGILTNPHLSNKNKSKLIFGDES